uniref:Uncharacterized protein n=1 Tax=Arundo donax TaxID=35708 RepID=A0A0A9B7N4_ARUDO
MSFFPNSSEAVARIDLYPI